MPQFWNALLGGGNGGCFEDDCGSGKRHKRRHKRRQHRRHERHERRESGESTCEELRSSTKMRVGVQVKIMKPKCISSCGKDCSSDSTCEVERFNAHIRVPWRVSIKKPKCLGEQCD